MNLPNELEHRKIREARHVGVTNDVYQIVFNQRWIPYGYWNPKPKGWEMKYASVEYHNDANGILDWILPDRECIKIVVERVNG